MASPRELLTQGRARNTTRQEADGFYLPREAGDPGPRGNGARPTASISESDFPAPEAPRPRREPVAKLRQGHAIYTDLMHRHDRLRTRHLGS